MLSIMASVVQILVERVFVIKFPGMAIISYRVAVTTFANNIPFKTWVYGPGGYSSLSDTGPGKGCRLNKGPHISTQRWYPSYPCKFGGYAALGGGGPCWDMIIVLSLSIHTVSTSKGLDPFLVRAVMT